MTFTGLAIYGTNVFREKAEDVSALVTNISPVETPLLNLLAQAERPAANVLHEWLEDTYSPNVLVTDSAVSSTTSSTAIGIASGLAAYLQVGAILEGPYKTASGNPEKMLVTAISGNTITVSRAFGGTSAGSIGTAQNLYFITDASLEGADVSVDTSLARTRLTNYVQMIKKDIIISGTVQAVTNLGNIGNEMNYQVSKKLREALRDLEKVAIRGVLSGNSIGGASNYRTMQGIRAFIATNVQSIATGNFNESWLGQITAAAWAQGGTDLDTIVVDANMKRIIDNFPGAGAGRPIVSDNNNTAYAQVVSTYENTFGRYNVVLSRWMPANEGMVISARRIAVVPLQNRSFQFVPVAKTGDADKGMVLGEYTLECRAEAGMARWYTV